ncbi:amine sulfotransferase [Elysia marginata]|uniref:Amine sulfotransferase n=1 Tax=Elysia marginata TaxID=1093978 RepID=A0AAV4F9Z7_9GAST|nr:amine sulfotransferase [Elysia marginata]
MFARLKNPILSSPVLYGPWWQHVTEAWERKDDENILILFYEDLHKDLEKNVRIIAKFLEKQLTDKQVETIVRHCSFLNMKNNSAVNYDWLKKRNLANKDVNFMRKGQVGDWKNHLSEDIVRRLDEMVASKLPRDIPITDSLPEANVAARL